MANATDTQHEEADVALKLLHTADWHLGRRFPSFEHDQELRLTRARLEVVGRILDLAASHDVDAVLCAGDLFDSPTPAEEWWRGVLDEFKKRDWQRPVVLLPGNHDPLNPRSLYDSSHPFRLGLPPYVHVVDRSDWRLSIGDGAVVLANPCLSASGQTNLVEALPQREAGDERIRIGLVHGQTFDIEGHQTNFPIAAGSAAARGLDYLAIGDTHAFREVEPDAAAPTIYPGAPEQTNFGESDTGNVALVFFPLDRRRRAIVRPERVGSWIWRDETCHSLAELRNLRMADGLRRTVLRLTLDMEVPMAEYDEAERILAELKGSAAATPQVGILAERREGLRLQPDGPLGFDDDVPDVIKVAAEQLRIRAAEDPEVAGRALHHLYRLTRKTAA